MNDNVTNMDWVLTYRIHTQTLMQNILIMETEKPEEYTLCVANSGRRFI